SCGGRFQWCSQVCKSSSAPLGRLLGSTLYRPVDSLLILVDESACHRTDIVSQGAAHEWLCAHVLGAELEQTPVRRWSVKTLVWVALLPDHCAVHNPDAKTKVASALEQSAIPAQAYVGGDGSPGVRVINTGG